jgi:cysteine desulfurase
MIYLDYVSTTPLNKEVLQTYTQLLTKYFANADSMHSLGYEVNSLMEKSRSLIAQYFHVTENELIFTSGASESNNTAIKGVAFAYQNRGKHLITTKVEHSSVLNTFKELEEVFGFDVDYINVDNQGRLDLKELEDKIRDDTILVSTMYVNNEVGMINPIKEISSIIKRKNPKIKYHVDMVQALGKLPIDLSFVDLASFSAHKINGLKGSGLLYKKHTTNIIPLINGGQQENGLRGGTSNALTNIVLAKTIRLALENREAHYNYVQSLNQYLRGYLNTLDDIVINTPVEHSSPYILNFSAVGYKPEVLVHDLETMDCYVSTKSACSSKKTDISSTLKAMNVDPKIGGSALRISFSHLTTKDEIDTFIIALTKSLNRVKKQR